MYSHTQNSKVPSRFNNGLIGTVLITIFAFGSLTACTPSVKVELPDKPININLNVKIQHEILIKIDKQLDSMFSSSSGLF